MFKRYPLLKMTIVCLTALFAAAMLTACGGGPDGSDEGQAPSDLPAAVVKAREALAADLNVDVDDVTVDSYEEAEWSDSCLGLGGPAESCLAAIHPGWLVMLSVEDVTYEVRTDETGDIIRIKQP